LIIVLIFIPVLVLDIFTAIASFGLRASDVGESISWLENKWNEYEYEK
jgi:hypothetical protein